MQPVIISNRFILGIVAFSVSFGLSLVPKLDMGQAFFTGIVTVVATYSAALFVDKRRRKYELLLLTSLRKQIKETEGLKSRLAREIQQLEGHCSLLYTESKQLQNKITETRNQRDSLHREIGSFASQKKQLKSEIDYLEETIRSLEQHQIELHNFLSTLSTEKRRLESSFQASQAEITELQTQINQHQQVKQELESSLTLLGRIKPQLEEKLHQLRLEIQDLETEKIQHQQLLIEASQQQEIITAKITALQTQKTEQTTEIERLQNEITLLQQERDILQNQVWDYLQQVENFHQDTTVDNPTSEPVNFLSLPEIIDLNSVDTVLTEIWQKLFQQMPGQEIQVLKAIVEQDNPNPAIKKIAETHITMPNLLIDAINERANDTIGELIITTDSDTPKIYPEHIINVRKVIFLYENLMTKHASSN